MTSQRAARLTLAGLLVLSTCLSFPTARKAGANDEPDYEPGQVVVRLAPLPDNSILGINQTYGTITLASLYNHTDIFLLQAPAGMSVEQLVAMMAHDPRLEYAELNYINQEPEDGSTDRIYGWGGQDDSAFRNQDAARALRLRDVHNLSRGAGALVAVLDTGAQLNHPVLVNRWSNLGYDFVDNDLTPADEANGLDDDEDGRVDEAYGHGTHVAGIIHLVAPEALILPLRVLNSDGRGNNFRTANAILYAAYNGADAINLSLGTAHPSRLLQDGVEEAAHLGAVVVAAAGNLNSTAPQYPAAEACAIAVTSVDSRNRKSSFASYGNWVDVAAPGEGIYSTFPVNGYAWWSGTSMSTPFVTGQAALLLSDNPELMLDEVGQLIGGTARSLEPFNPAYRGLLGAGLIDVLESLESLAVGGWPPEGNLFAGCNTQ
ncbi:MAG: S8 family serine peptidase [Anaerolineales bacterium]